MASLRASVEQWEVGVRHVRRVHVSNNVPIFPLLGKTLVVLRRARRRLMPNQEQRPQRKSLQSPRTVPVFPCLPLIQRMSTRSNGCMANGNPWNHTINSVSLVLHYCVYRYSC